MIEKLQIIKNLIENKEFSKAFSETNLIGQSYDEDIEKIYNSVKGLNFGKALLEIDIYIFENSDFSMQKIIIEKNSIVETNESHFERQTYEDYNGSYAQDYEHLSDQFINDVLEGDPDNYWNID